MSDPGPLEEQAEAFAAELTATLQGALPGAPQAKAEVSQAGRAVVSPDGDVELFVAGEALAVLDVRLRCELDSRGTWLAVEASSVGLIAKVDRTPVIRFDYVREPHTAPAAHIQVHAHRGALTHLLSRTGHSKPHDISALHLPVGGSRFRPCLEDVIQFLIADCGFDGVASWREAVFAGRATWRRTQVKAVVRDFQVEAAEALERLGWTVAPPADLRSTPEKALYNW